MVFDVVVVVAVAVVVCQTSYYLYLFTMLLFSDCLYIFCGGHRIFLLRGSFMDAGRRGAVVSSCHKSVQGKAEDGSILQFCLG